MSYHDIKQTSFDGLVEYNKWKSKHYEAQDGIKEVGGYWGDDGRIYISYIELY